MPAQKDSCRWANPALSDSVFKMFDMHGRVVIITGGTGGIGYEVARGLAEAGADVSINRLRNDLTISPSFTMSLTTAVRTTV